MIGGRGIPNDGQTLILLGVSRGNIERLQQGKPLHLTHATHPYIPEGFVFLRFSGETEEARQKQLIEAGIELRP